MSDGILRVERLSVSYDHQLGPVKAVDDVSFSLRPRERFGLAGESGSGKSTMALAMLRMIKPPGHIEGGAVWLGDTALFGLNDDAMRRLRLAGIAMVPQGSMNSLNPVIRIRDQIHDALADHDERLSKRELDSRVRALLAQVGLPPEIADKYPHELSGGMKQRACIAIAICLRPKVIIADEPTSALDVVVQRQVMETLGRVQAELGAAVILIGHDMGLMAQFVDRLGDHVCGPIGRGGADRRHHHRAAASLYTLADREPALAGAQRGAARHSRPGAAAARTAAGLRVPSSLPDRGGALPHREARSAAASATDASVACHLA